MGNLIGGVLYILFLYFVFTAQSRNHLVRLLAFYIVCCIVSPVFTFGARTISFEWLSFPVMLLYSLNRSNLPTVLMVDRTFIKAVAICFSIMIPATVFGVWLAGNYLQISEGIGTLRIVITLFIIVRLITRLEKDEIIELVSKIIFAIGLINLICCLIQLFVPNSLNLFYTLYHTSSQKYWDTLLAHGVLRRTFGAMANSPYLGGISLQSAALALYLLSKQNVKKSKVLFALICSIITGLMSLSKTFILGIVVVMFIYLFFTTSRGIFKKLLLVVVCVFLFAYVGNYLISNTSLSAERYLSFLSDPLRATNSRYSEDAALIQLVFGAFKESPILGCGFTRVTGAIGSDSTYIHLLFRCGVVGTIVFFYGFLSMFVRNYRYGEKQMIIVLIAILLIFVGLTWCFRIEFVIPLLVALPKENFVTPVETRRREI